MKNCLGRLKMEVTIVIVLKQYIVLELKNPFIESTFYATWPVFDPEVVVGYIKLYSIP